MKLTTSKLLIGDWCVGWLVPLHTRLECVVMLNPFTFAPLPIRERVTWLRIFVWQVLGVAADRLIAWRASP